MEKNQEVTFLVNSFPEERGRTKYQHAKHLAETFNTTIISLGDVPDPITVEAQEVYSFTESPLSSLKLFFPFWILFHLLTNDSDCIVVSPHSILVIESSFVRFITGQPLVVDFWDDIGLPEAFYKDKSPIRYKIKHLYHVIIRRFAERFLKDADRIITSIHPGILKKYGIDDKKVVHLTNGVCDDVFEKPDQSSEEEFRIVYLGHAIEMRGVHRLINAVTEADVDNIQMDIIGPTDDVVEATAEEHSNVTLHGRVPHSDALDIVTQADVCLCLLPAHIENYQYSYPIKIFEYAALGKPIIASDYLGIRKILTDEMDALLLSHDSSLAVRRALERLARNPDLRAQLGHNAKRTAEQYRWSTILDSYSDEISQVMQH